MSCNLNSNSVQQLEAFRRQQQPLHHMHPTAHHGQGCPHASLDRRRCWGRRLDTLNAEESSRTGTKRPAEKTLLDVSASTHPQALGGGWNPQDPGPGRTSPFRRRLRAFRIATAIPAVEQEARAPQ